MNRILFFGLLLLFVSCIGDDIIEDFVEPVIRITNPIETIQKNTDYQFEFSYFNNIGRKEEVAADWFSSNSSVITISDTGLASAIAEGESTIRVSYSGADFSTMDEFLVVVGDTTTLSGQKSGTIQSTSGYTLRGDFTLTQEGDDLLLEIASNWAASSTLPGLYVYLSNNPNSRADALEISAVTVFSGAHSYNIPDTDINDFSYVLYFCKPFNVKVGHGVIQ